MVRSRRGRLGAFALSLMSVGLAATLPLMAQDEPTKAPPSYRRVPAYFGQVGLTPDQREQIYTIRGKYQDQIAELKRQLAELQRAELSECETVLTEAQRKLLEQRRASRKAPTDTAAPLPTATPEPEAKPASGGDETEPG